MEKNAVIAGFAVGGAVIGWFAGPVVAKLAKYLIATIGGLTGQVLRGMSEFSSQSNKVNHLIYGSRGNDHLWRLLVRNENWTDISKIITKVLIYGSKARYKSVSGTFINTLRINGHIVQVTYRIISGVMKITDGWVVK